jgi:nucleoside-diphosphate-sugar epimerase
VRLNYAHDLRYGVLTDLAARIVRREPIELGMSYVNVIWQGDANALALAALARATTPEPTIINVAGPRVLRVADLATTLGKRLGVEPSFTGTETSDALLSNGAAMRYILGDPLLPLDTLLDWVADWVGSGGRLLGKPTGFERRDGRF